MWKCLFWKCVWRISVHPIIKSWKVPFFTSQGTCLQSRVEEYLKQQRAPSSTFLGTRGDVPAVSLNLPSPATQWLCEGGSWNTSETQFPHLPLLPPADPSISLHSWPGYSPASNPSVTFHFTQKESQTPERRLTRSHPIPPCGRFPHTTSHPILQFVSI